MSGTSETAELTSADKLKQISRQLEGLLDYAVEAGRYERSLDPFWVADILLPLKYQLIALAKAA